MSNVIPVINSQEILELGQNKGGNNATISGGGENFIHSPATSEVKAHQYNGDKIDFNNVSIHKNKAMSNFQSQNFIRSSTTESGGSSIIYPQQQQQQQGGGQMLSTSQETRINFLNFLYFWGIGVIYTLLGAWIFQVIEHQPELNHIKSVQSLVQDARINFTRSLVTQLNCSNSMHLTNNLSSIIAAYENLLDDLVNGQLHNYLSSNTTSIDPSDTSWGLYSHSISFVVTLITTIGYGNISPKTSGGRIFCIGYSIIGIPLMLIVISKTGKIFASLTIRIHRKMLGRRLSWKYLSSTSNSPPTRMQRAVGTSLSVSGMLILLLIYLTIGAFLYSKTESWGFLNSFYFCFITLTTIGLGDLTPKIESGPTLFAITRSVYILLGLALTSTCIELVRKQYTIWNKEWTTYEVEKAAAKMECSIKRKIESCHHSRDVPDDVNTKMDSLDLVDDKQLTKSASFNRINENNDGSGDSGNSTNRY